MEYEGALFTQPVFILCISINWWMEEEPLNPVSADFSIKTLIQLFSSYEPGLNFVINEDNTEAFYHLDFS